MALSGPSGPHVPVWLTRRHAEEAIEATWPGFHPVRISRASFIARLPLLALFGVAIGISPPGARDGILAPPERLHADLQQVDAAQPGAAADRR